jgi:hypothetical protein
VTLHPLRRVDRTHSVYFLPGLRRCQSPRRSSAVRSVSRTEAPRTTWPPRRTPGAPRLATRCPEARRKEAAADAQPTLKGRWDAEEPPRRDDCDGNEERRRGQGWPSRGGVARPARRAKGRAERERGVRVMGPITRRRAARLGARQGDPTGEFSPDPLPPGGIESAAHGNRSPSSNKH